MNHVRNASMMPQPQFQIGDGFIMPFEGKVEDVIVRVTKPLVVTAVTMDTNYKGVRYVYKLHSPFKPEMGPAGNGYSYQEIQLVGCERMEPVAEAAFKAQI